MICIGEEVPCGNNLTPKLRPPLHEALVLRPRLVRGCEVRAHLSREGHVEDPENLRGVLDVPPPESAASRRQRRYFVFSKPEILDVYG